MLQPPAGGTQVLFLEVVVPEPTAVPRRLSHRLSFAEGMIAMPPVAVGTRAVKTLARPVTGADWIAADGPGSDPDNHHRRGLFVLDGVLTDSRRLAIDWKIVRGGRSYSGDAREPHVHLEVTDTARTLAAEGLPYVIDRYTVMASGAGTPGLRRGELPLDGMIVDFGR